MTISVEHIKKRRRCRKGWKTKKKTARVCVVHVNACRTASLITKVTQKEHLSSQETHRELKRASDRPGISCVTMLTMQHRLSLLTESLTCGRSPWRPASGPSCSRRSEGSGAWPRRPPTCWRPRRGSAGEAAARRTWPAWWSSPCLRREETTERPGRGTETTPPLAGNH